MQEKIRVQHTSLVLRLIPTSITPHILWLLMLLSTTTTEHLIEEAELCTRAPDKRCENREKNLKARHIHRNISCVCDKRRVTCVKRKSKVDDVSVSPIQPMQTSQTSCKQSPGKWQGCVVVLAQTMESSVVRKKLRARRTGISSSALSRHPYATTLPIPHVTYRIRSAANLIFSL